MLLVAVSGVLRASLSVMLPRGNGDLLSPSAPITPALERLHALAPDPQITIGALRLLLILAATLLATLFALSLGFSGWGIVITFMLLLVLLLALEGGALALGRRYAHQVARFGVRPLLGLTWVVGPLVRRLPAERWSASARSLLGPLPSHDQAESAGSTAGLPAQGEVQMVRAVLELRATQVKEVLVHRVDIIAAEVTDPLSRAVELALAHGYSRIPVYQDTIDQIVGIVYARDLLQRLQEGSLEAVTLREVARPTIFVPESKGVYELLQEFQERHVHIAIVVDEYGGTAGLVTIEDLLEEIVGEIEDEFDREEPKVEKVGEKEAIVDARLSLDDLKELLDVELQGQGFDTLGGFIYSHLGRVPNPGDEFSAEGLHIEVLSTAGRRIRKVRLAREVSSPQEEGAPTAGGP